MPSFRLTLAYDGTCFAGSQIQPNQRTVQGELDRALETLVGAQTGSTFAGRTDRGVHAVGQVAVVRPAAWRGTEDQLERALNARLPRDLAVLAVVGCDDDFNPRFDATWREYRYRIVPAEASPFVRRYAWTPRTEVDAGAMAAAAERFVGRHDFASFAGGGEGVPWSERARRPHGTVRTILRCDCRDVSVNTGPVAESAAPGFEIRVAADGFLPRMVRNIVGALVEIGQGRQTPQWIDEVLVAKDRRFGSVVAPPQGLTLWRIGFGDDRLDDG